MPVVTGLAPARRRSGWTEVELDGASAGLLPDEEVFGLRLKAGLELGREAAGEVRMAVARAEAMRVGLRYLSVRPRSRREVERRLRRGRTDGEAIRQALERFDALGYLNDEAFAAAFTRDRIRLRPCGLRRMRSDLRSRGVSSEEAERGIAAAMEEEETTEAELLDRLAARRKGRLGGLEPAAARRRLFDYLARRGFPAGLIRDWIAVHLPEGDE